MRLILALAMVLTPSLLGGQQKTVIASWYGGKFQGRTTANGSVFDTSKMTAAYNQVPLGTILKVCNVSRDTCIKVKVNDRTHKRFSERIDLSKGAFKRLGDIEEGLIEVNIENKM